MLELANQTISRDQIDALITTMYEAAGLRNKQELNIGDFLKLLGDHREEFGYVELNLDGKLIVLKLIDFKVRLCC